MLNGTRPIFSPTDFIQIKGRGTRTFTFSYKTRVNGEDEVHEAKKDTFKLFDFFVEAAAAIAIYDLILGNTQTDRRKP